MIRRLLHNLPSDYVLRKKLLSESIDSEKFYPYFSKERIRSVSSFLEQYNSIESNQFDRSEESLYGIIAVTEGRVTSIRESSKNLLFCDIQQEASTVQAILSKDRFGSVASFENAVKSLQRGDIIEINGNPGRNKRGQLCLFAKEMKILSPCLHHIPGRQGFNDIVWKFTYCQDQRFQKRSLDLLVNSSAIKVLQKRSKYLDKLGFIEVETPILCKTTGGANARPFVTKSVALKSDFSLRISPELYLKRLIIGGMEKVYEIGKQFRNEGIDRTHSPEFTTCELYCAYSNMNSMLDFTESFFKDLVQHTHESLSVPFQNSVIDFSKPFQRIEIIPFLEKKLNCSIPLEIPEMEEFLIGLFKTHSLSLPHPPTVTRMLDELIGHFIEPECMQPTFLIGHPLAMSPLAKSKDGKISSRFELFIQGKEYVNSYSELNNPFEQRMRFQRQQNDKKSGDAEAQEFDEEFCEALELGMPPAAGWGLGIDRLVMLLTDSDSLKEVQAFPMK